MLTTKNRDLQFFQNMLLTEEADGDAGFGYDPVFLPDELDRTFARCSSDEKNRISHRARAMMKLREKLESSRFLTY